MPKRLFIGFPVVCQQAKLQKVFTEIKKAAEAQKIHAKWISIENFHLTLKFLGVVAEEKMTNIEQALFSIVPHHSVFNFEIRGVGAFPNLKRPRVLWMGAKCKKEILSLQNDVEKAMVNLGFKADLREYAPHITIGRLKKIHSIEKIFSPFEKTFLGTTKIRSVILYESRLGKDGSIYTPLKEVPLHD